MANIPQYKSTKDLYNSLLSTHKDSQIPDYS